MTGSLKQKILSQSSLSIFFVSLAATIFSFVGNVAAQSNEKDKTNPPKDQVETKVPTAKKLAEVKPIVTEKKWYDYIEIHPFIVLRTTIKFKNLKEPKADINRAGLLVSANFGAFKLYIEPRFRQTKKRSFFPSNFSLSQAYLSYNTPIEGLSISGGILYNRYGFFWDGSFFGTIPLFVGEKIDADYNLELAYKRKFDNFGINSWLQFTLGSDGINSSLMLKDKKAGLNAPNDFETDANYQQGVGLRLRVEPYITFSDFTITPGISAEYIRAKRDKYQQKIIEKGKEKSLTLDAIAAGNLRVAADLTLAWRNYKLMGEINANFINKDFAYVPTNSSINRYYFSTAAIIPLFQRDAEWFTSMNLTGGFSYGLYKSENLGWEYIVRTGLDLKVHKYIRTTLEYARWSIKDKDPVLHRIELLLYAYF